MAVAQRVRPSQKQASQVAVATPITPQNVMASVQTTVETVVGTFASSRGLLPPENFKDRFIKENPSQASKLSGSQASQWESMPSQEIRRRFKVTKIKRGASNEGDQILSYLKNGVMQSISKGYLKRLTIVVLLDPNKPDNIVESHSIEFLETAFNSIKTVEELRNTVYPFFMDIGLQTYQRDLAVLPRAKYLDMKLDFNHKAPSDYQPINFCDFAGKLTMGTRFVYEVPTRIDMGMLQMPLVSVRVSLASAAKYLPEEPTADESISQGRLSNLHEAQLTNAEAREVSWSVHNLPQRSTTITHHIPYEDVARADLPAVCNLFGRFGERGGPWDEIESTDQEETLPHSDELQAETHQTLPHVAEISYPSSGTLEKLDLLAAPVTPIRPVKQVLKKASAPKKPRAPKKPKAASSATPVPKPKAKPKPKPKPKAATAPKKKPSPKPNAASNPPTAQKPTSPPTPISVPTPARAHPSIKRSRPMAPLLQKSGGITIGPGVTGREVEHAGDGEAAPQLGPSVAPKSQQLPQLEQPPQSQPPPQSQTPSQSQHPPQSQPPPQSQHPLQRSHPSAQGKSRSSRLLAPLNVSNVVVVPDVEGN